MTSRKELDVLLGEIRTLPKAERDKKLKAFQKKKQDEIVEEIKALRLAADQEEKERNRKIEKQKTNAKLIFAGLVIHYYPEMIQKVFQETAKAVTYSAREAENIKVLLSDLGLDVPEFNIRATTSKAKIRETTDKLNAILDEIEPEDNTEADPFEELFGDN